MFGRRNVCHLSKPICNGRRCHLLLQPKLSTCLSWRLYSILACQASTMSMLSTSLFPKERIVVKTRHIYNFEVHSSLLLVSPVTTLCKPRNMDYRSKKNTQSQFTCCFVHYFLITANQWTASTIVLGSGMFGGNSTNDPTGMTGTGGNRCKSGSLLGSDGFRQPFPLTRVRFISTTNFGEPRKNWGW